MDKSLRQTLGAFDLVQLSHKWVSTILICGKHSTTVQAWIVSRLWWRSRRLKINIRRNSVHFRSHTFVPIGWMCKKQISVSHSSTEAETNSLDAGLCKDGIPAFRSQGFGDWSVPFFTKTIQKKKNKDDRVPRGNLSARTQPNMRHGYETHPRAITFPPEAGFFVEPLSTSPCASRNTFSVSTITDGYARVRRPQHTCPDVGLTVHLSRLPS